MQLGEAKAKLPNRKHVLFSYDIVGNMEMSLAYFSAFVVMKKDEK